jgi:hypothetical protein
MADDNPPLSSADLAWMGAGERVYRAGPNAAPLPPLDNERIQRLWLGGFAIAWLEAGEHLIDPKNDPLGWLCQDDVRAALAQRLAGHPALLARLAAYPALPHRRRG